MSTTNTSGYFIHLLIRMNAKYLFGFGATGVQACLTTPLFVMFVHKVYLEGVTPDHHHVGEILASSPHVARHTSVVLMRRPSRLTVDSSSASDKLVVDEFRWTHPTLRPWGAEVPIQCPTCGAVSSLKSKQHHGGAIVVACQAQGCEYTLTHTKPAELQLIHGGDGGTWTVCTRS